MRLLVPALLLSSTVSCLCQNAQKHSVDPDQLFQMPRQFQSTSRDFGKPPSLRAPLPLMLLPRVIRPGQVPKIGAPHLDAEIIHRPMQGNFALQQPRTPMASGLYPDLKVLPVETARVDVAPAE